MSYHGEAGKAQKLWVIEYNGGQGGAMGSGYAVIAHIHRPLVGNCSTVGVSMTTPGGLRVGNWL